MNSKSEFHHPGIVRVVAIRGNVNEEQFGMFPRDGRGGKGGEGGGEGGEEETAEGGGEAEAWLDRDAAGSEASDITREFPIFFLLPFI